VKFHYFVRKETSLEASFRFSDFKTAFDFMSKVAVLAEKLKHHPDWSNNYNCVFIKLRTHDAGNVLTDLDFELATEIEHIAKKYHIHNET
jgi:4a-hydroxytetrahydrobiopterin dehydratase